MLRSERQEECTKYGVKTFQVLKAKSKAKALFLKPGRYFADKALENVF
jgi:hypothetical protein